MGNRFDLLGQKQGRFLKQGLVLKTGAGSDTVTGSVAVAVPAAATVSVAGSVAAAVPVCAPGGIGAQYQNESTATKDSQKEMSALDNVSRPCCKPQRF